MRNVDGIRLAWNEYVEALDTRMRFDRMAEHWEAARRYDIRTGKPIVRGEFPREVRTIAAWAVVVKASKHARMAGTL